MIRLAIAALSLLVSCAVQSQGTPYPSKPVRILIPSAPGGTPDLLGRMLAQRFTERLGQPFVAENRAGANGNLAGELTARAAPDGHVLFLATNGNLSINPAIYVKIPYDPIADFAPVSIAGSGGFYFLACPSHPAGNMRDLIALAKQKPNALSYASSGFGSNNHLAGEMLNAFADVKITHIPYKAFAQGVPDTMACKVDVAVGSVAGGLPFIKSGKLKALGVTTAARFPGTPEVATMIESGMPNFEAVAYYGIVTTAGTPRPVVDRLHTEMLLSLKDRDTAEKLLGQGLLVVGNTPEQFSARIRAELELYTKLAKTLNLRID